MISKIALLTGAAVPYAGSVPITLPFGTLSDLTKNCA
jgi:hypothetical protein